MNKIPLKNRSKEIVAYALVDSSDFGWLTDLGRWSLNPNGYPQVWYKKHTRYMHQVILGLEPGYREQDVEAEHLNQDKLDNRRSNLRVGNRTTNSRNQTEPQTNSTTGHLNVHRLKNGYQVRIFGKYYGYFKDLSQAAAVAESTRHRLQNMSD